jgi:hypothetical protein
MDILVETANPEWFIWQSDQGYLPLAEVKNQMQRFAREIMPHYQERHENSQTERRLAQTFPG